MLLEKYKSSDKGYAAICKCDYCSKEYRTIYSLVIKAKHHFCGRNCYALWRTGRKFSDVTKRKISLATIGENNPMWKGGKTIDEFGYILISKPEHPFASVNGYVREHRLIMEEALGRYLTPKEVIHHINGKKDDNRLENLIFFQSRNEHMAFHRANKKALLSKSLVLDK